MSSVMNQGGLVLTICLIIMTILTLVVMQSMQSSSLQGVMADNMRDEIEAMSNAESTLLAAESMLESLVSYEAFDTHRDDGMSDDVYVDAWREVDWVTQVHATSDGAYIVQHLSSTPVVGMKNDHSNDTHIHIIDSFKITVKGMSANKQTVVFLESIFNNSLNKQRQSPLLGRCSWFKSGV